MRVLSHQWLWSLLLCSQCAGAQTIFHDDRNLAADSPEAWAMNYMAGTTFMTGSGDDAQLAHGRWNIAFELGEIPRLDAAKRQVGLGGTKIEELNKSPVFGRLRLSVGLPAGWVGELGYTPPLVINGLRAQGLLDAAIGHPVIRRDAWGLSARIFGQHGSALGDITCPADIAGISDSEKNPYGCQAPSHDRVALNYYGADLTAAGARGEWHWHVGAGIVRTELEVQLDALTFSFRDRSRLTANGMRRFMVIGASRDIGTRWTVGVEALHVPNPVRRTPDNAVRNDPLNSFRIRLGFRY